MLRKNRTIDWQKKEKARAQMRKMVKRLLKKYKYPPEDYDFAINTVIRQCELWTDNVEPRKEEKLYKYVSETELEQGGRGYGSLWRKEVMEVQYGCT